MGFLEKIGLRQFLLEKKLKKINNEIDDKILKIKEVKNKKVSDEIINKLIQIIITDLINLARTFELILIEMFGINGRIINIPKNIYFKYKVSRIQKYFINYLYIDDLGHCYITTVVNDHIIIELQTTKIQCIRRSWGTYTEIDKTVKNINLQLEKFKKIHESKFKDNYKLFLNFKIYNQFEKLFINNISKKYFKENFTLEDLINIRVKNDKYSSKYQEFILLTLLDFALFISKFFKYPAIENYIFILNFNKHNQSEIFKENYEKILSLIKKELPIILIKF